MDDKSINKMISEMSINEIKNMIFSMMEQIFPVLDEEAKREFVLKMMGKSGDEKISSMVHL